MALDRVGLPLKGGRGTTNTEKPQEYFYRKNKLIALFITEILGITFLSLVYSHLTYIFTE
jgi:hypothetical protein